MVCKRSVKSEGQIGRKIRNMLKVCMDRRVPYIIHNIKKGIGLGQKFCFLSNFKLIFGIFRLVSFRSAYQIFRFAL